MRANCKCSGPSQAVVIICDKSLGQYLLLTTYDGRGTPNYSQRLLDTWGIVYRQNSVTKHETVYRTKLCDKIIPWPQAHFSMAKTIQSTILSRILSLKTSFIHDRNTARNRARDKPFYVLLCHLPCLSTVGSYGARTSSDFNCHDNKA